MYEHHSAQTKQTKAGSRIPPPEICKIEGEDGPTTRYGCKCGKQFALLRTYDRHVLDKHRARSYRCKMCTKTFSNRQLLKEHCETMHQEGRIPCRFCLKTFTTRSSLRLHHDAIHKGIRYPCVQCNKSFGQLGSLRRHVNTIHNRAQSNTANVSSKRTNNISREKIQTQTLEIFENKSDGTSSSSSPTDCTRNESSEIHHTTSLDDFESEFSFEKDDTEAASAATGDTSNEMIFHTDEYLSSGLGRRRHQLDYFETGISPRNRFDFLMSLGVDKRECDAIATLVSMKA